MTTKREERSTVEKSKKGEKKPQRKPKRIVYSEDFCNLLNRSQEDFFCLNVDKTLIIQKETGTDFSFKDIFDQMV